MIDKKELRRSMIRELAEIDDRQRQAISENMQEVLFKSDIWKGAKTIGIYLSFKTEWDTRNIVKRAFKEGKAVALPKTIPGPRRLDFYKIDNLSQTEKIKSGQFYIEEPILGEAVYLDKNDIDLLLVPGLVFSKDGYRIGFGGGYYDRFLTDFINRTVSLASEHQIKELLPIEDHDIPVDYIVSENKLIRIHR